MRGQLWNAVLDMQSGKAKDNCIPSLTETGQMEPFLARVAHNLLQVQIEGLPPVGFSGLCQAILGRKEGVAGKAEGGVMDTQGLKVLPGGQLFLFGKLLWQTGYKEQRIIYYIPVLTSWVAASMIWKSMLSPEYGAVNNILAVFGIQGPGWLLDEAWAMPAIVLVSVWKDMGFFGLILLSGMVGINKSYYEAASLDGAGSWQKFWKITLPLMTPAIFYVLIVSLINAFQLFPQIMIMTDGGPNGATQVMVERIYKYGFRYYRMGYAAAFSWILFAIIMVCTAIQMKGQERWVNYDS